MLCYVGTDSHADRLGEENTLVLALVFKTNTKGENRKCRTKTSYCTRAEFFLFKKQGLAMLLRLSSNSWALVMLLPQFPVVRYLITLCKDMSL